MFVLSCNPSKYVRTLQGCNHHQNGLPLGVIERGAHLTLAKVARVAYGGPPQESKTTKNANRIHQDSKR